MVGLFTYLKSPGYLSDIVSRHVLHFGMQEMIRDCESYRVRMIRYEIGDKLKSFPAIEKEVEPFCYLVDGKRSFLGDFVLQNPRFLDKSFTFDVLLAQLTADQNLCKRLLTWYLGDDSRTLAFKSTNEGLFVMQKRILDLELPENIRMHLCLMLLEPGKYVQALRQSLTSTHEHMQVLYAQNQHVVLECNRRFEDVSTQENFFAVNKAEYARQEDHEIFFTSCVLDDSVMSCITRGNQTLCMTGLGMLKKLDEMARSAKEPDLIRVSRALGDTVRLQILQLLLKNGEMFSSEIASGVGLALNAIFYHLNMLYESGLLVSRVDKKRIYFRVNKEFYHECVDSLNRMSLVLAEGRSAV